MGLGTVKESNGMYLSVAGGFIWNRKADANDPNYATQDYDKVDGTTGTRKGARYADLTGNVTGVVFRTHDEYGESINVTVESGGDKYIISVSTNNRNSQDLMKALLLMDLTKPLFIKPYDFIGSDKKRAQGISFRQDGEKISLRYDDAPTKEKDWFKTATKKQIRRFFEDLSDWFVQEVTEKVIPQLDKMPKPEAKSGLGAATENVSKPIEEKEVDEEPTKTQPEAKKELSIVQKRKFLRAYIADNYEDKKLPQLAKEDVKVWYDLAQAEEELPFPTEGEPSAEMSKESLNGQLKNLLDV